MSVKKPWPEQIADLEARVEELEAEVRRHARAEIEWTKAAKGEAKRVQELERALMKIRYATNFDNAVGQLRKIEGIARQALSLSRP